MHWTDKVTSCEPQPLKRESWSKLNLYSRIEGILEQNNMTDSPGVRTRRQAAAEAKQVAEKPTMNGHANGSAGPKKAAMVAETSENIFLFYPNIIGTETLNHLMNGKRRLQ